MFAHHSSVTAPDIIDVNTESSTAVLPPIDENSVRSGSKLAGGAEWRRLGTVVEPGFHKHKNTALSHSSHGRLE